MLIVTLPTIVSSVDTELAKRMLAHPLVHGARYNTGGDSPFSPEQIMRKLHTLQSATLKPIYIDVDGRQLRVAEWRFTNTRCVVLNRDIALSLPASVHFRGFGWYEVVATNPLERKLFFALPQNSPGTFCVGASQTAHIVGPDVRVCGGYLSERDKEFIRCAAKFGFSKFMLSFFEEMSDIDEFRECFFAACGGYQSLDPELVLKIESQKGVAAIATVKNLVTNTVRLLAARDDLYLSFVRNRQDFLGAVKLVVAKDPRAIVASRIMAGVEAGEGLRVGDLADVTLLKQFGYQQFMWSDELAQKFFSAIQQWQNVILPLLQSMEV